MVLTNRHIRRAATAFCWAGASRRTCVLLLALLSACASTQRDGGSQSQSVAATRHPAAALLRLAESEHQDLQLQGRLVPPPPGIERQMLVVDAEANASRELSLDEVIVRLSSEYQPPAPEPQRDLDAIAQSTALRHYVKGREAALDDRHIVAITEFNRALEFDPGGGEILKALARSHIALGNSNRAGQTYERLLQIYPDDEEAQLAVAMAVANRGDFQQAAGILATRFAANEPFEHDQGAELLAQFTFAAAIRELKFDRAGIELVRRLVHPRSHSIEQTRYAPQLNAAYRAQPELWRWVGDAHCRLGEFEAAIKAYDQAAELASPDSSIHLPRAVYANLRLGRVYSAQRELLAALQSDAASISERDIRLCAYLFEHASPTHLLSAAVKEMHSIEPDRSDLARAAASLLPMDEATGLLRTFVDRKPRDLQAVGQLLRWLARSGGPEDVQAALHLTLNLINAHPDLSGEYINKLYHAMPEPQLLVEAARVHSAASESAPAGKEIEIRTLGRLGALGEAWSLQQDARERWPGNESMLLLEMDLAVMLEEPAIIARSLAGVPEQRSVAMLLGLARTHRAAGNAGQAMHFAELAVNASEELNASKHQKLRALLEHAHACVAFATEQPDSNQMQAWCEEAAAIAMRGLELDHASDETHEFLLSLYGAGGPLQNPDAFRAAAARLYEANPESRLYTRLAAEEAINHGRFEQAIEWLMHLYDADPSDVRSLRLVLATWVRQGRFDEATQWVRERLADRPGDAALLEACADLMVRSDRSEEVIESLELAANDPHHHIARRLLESIFRSTGRAEKAFALGVDRLLARPLGVRRETELAALYAGMGMREQAISRIRWVAAQADDATYDHLATIVAVLGRMDNPDQENDELTVQIVEQAIQRRPLSPLQLYGTALRSLARLDSIDTRFDQIARQAAESAHGASGPTVQHALVWRELAQALIDEGQAGAAARALYVRAVADVPLEPDALGALATFAIVADAAVPDGEGRLSLALVHELAAQRRLPRLSGMPAAESITAVLFHASQIFGLVGNEAGAETLLREVIAYDAHHAMARNNLGYQRIEAGHHDEETISWIEHAHELDSDDASILDTLGWLRYKQEQLDGDDGALALIQRSRETSGEPSAEVLDHLGDIHWRMGDSDAAVAHWQRAASMLDDPQQKQRSQQNYLLLQSRGWGLLVADPAELYNRDIGVRLERLQRKLQAVERGEKPPVAATFAEGGE